MPLNINWQQILLHLLNFAILGGGLYLLLYKPVKDFMEKRTAHYQAMDDEAQQKLQDAEAMKADYTKALAGIDDDIRREKEQARLALRQDTQRQLDQAREQAASIVTEARKTARRQKEKALQESNQELQDLAVSAARKLVMNEDVFDQFLRAADRRAQHEETN